MTKTIPLFSKFITEMARFSGQLKYFEDIQQTLKDSQKQYYTDDYFNTVMERVNQLSDPRVVSSDYSPVYISVEHALLSQRPKARYFAGTGAQISVTLATHCPNWFLDWLFTSSPALYLEKGLLPPNNMQFD